MRGRPSCGGSCASGSAVAYPGAVLLPESERRAPRDIGVRGGFDADFFVVNQQEHSALFNNGGAGTLPWLPDHRALLLRRRRCRRGGRRGGLGMFLRLWEEHRAAAGGDRLVVLPRRTTTTPGCVTGARTRSSSERRSRSCSHGVRSRRSTTATRSACATSTASPTTRAACASPATTAPAAARRCSGTTPCPTPASPTAPPDRLYLPAGPGRPRPTVAAQTDDPDSPLNRVRRLVRLRRETPALRTGAATEVLTRDYPFGYLRGGSHLVVVNPGRGRVTARAAGVAGRTVTPLEVSGVRRGRGEMDADGFGYGVFALA